MPVIKKVDLWGIDARWDSEDLTWKVRYRPEVKEIFVSSKELDGAIWEIIRQLRIYSESLKENAEELCCAAEFARVIEIQNSGSFEILDSISKGKQ
jgi:hypothetical protein